MRQIITTLLCAIVLIATASFKPTSLKDIKKLNGKWKIIEIKSITFLPNEQYNIRTSSISNGNIKEYVEKGLSFETYNPTNKSTLKGRWNVAEGKIIETINIDQATNTNPSMLILDYSIKNDKLIVEYRTNQNNVIIQETWRKLK